jgi:hypothetical protein
MNFFLLALPLLAALDVAKAFPVFPRAVSKLGHGRQERFIRRNSGPLHAEGTTSTTNDGTTAVYQSIFNFTNPTENAVSKFERIDDAVREILH